jgi:hypothetical protein
MRNYIEVIRQEFDQIDWTDPNNPFITGSLGHFSADFAEAVLFADSLTPASPGTSGGYQPEAPPFPQYFLMDKKIALEILNNTGAINIWNIYSSLSSPRDGALNDIPNQWPTNDGKSPQQALKKPKDEVAVFLSQLAGALLAANPLLAKTAQAIQQLLKDYLKGEIQADYAVKAAERLIDSVYAVAPH